MNQPPSFLHDIPSIHQKNPDIPAVLANLDLNRGVRAGDALDYEEVIHANAVASALKSYRGELASRLASCQALYFCITTDSGDPLATQEMVKTATSRAVAVETACMIKSSLFYHQ
jgi:hypothetical protein